MIKILVEVTEWVKEYGKYLHSPLSKVRVLIFEDI